MSKVAVCLLWTEVHNKLAWITYMIIELNSWAICTHYRFTISQKYLPFTTSLAEVFRFSMQNTKVPVSSTDRLEIVRLWTCPFALIRKWLVGLSLSPFLIHVPGTLGWDTSTSKEAVSLSVVLMSVSPLLIVIFRATEASKWEKSCLRDWEPNTGIFISGI